MQAASAYNFSEDWFSHHIPSWTRILEGLRPGRVLEIGSYEGRSASFLIETCSRYGPLSLYCIDPWQCSRVFSQDKMKRVEQRFDDNVGVAVRRASALAALIATGSPPFDLVYVDGSDTATDVLLDAVLAFHIVRVGGVMVFDDYLWSMEPLRADTANTPKLAIDTFRTVYAPKVRVLHELPSAQCCIEKIAV
jgi:predicted O-methyltransferase YrrM